MADNRFVPLSYYLPPILFDFIELPEDFLDNIGILESRIEVEERIIPDTEETFTDTETYYDETGEEEITVTWTETQVERKTNIIFTIANSRELFFRIPGLDGIELVITSTESPGASPFTATLTINDDGTFAFEAGISFNLRFDRDILKPMVRTDAENGGFEEDTSVEQIEIEIGEVELGLDSEGVHFGAGMSFEITRPVMVGDTGVIIDHITGVALNLTGDGQKPNNVPEEEDWKGLYIESAAIHIPDVMSGSINAEGLGIGTGGLYGRIAAEWDLRYDPERDPGERFTGSDLAGRVMGMEGGISSIALEFEQCIPVEFDIQGKILFPFFDEPIDVSIGVDIDGDFQLILADTDEDGMFMLRKENILEAKLESISFEKKEDLFIASISGSIKPLVGEINWPEFDVEKLSIDSEGNVHIDGGWIDVPDKLTFDLRGFKMEVTQVGFGKDEDEHGDEYMWIGLSGGIQLVEGLEAGASVEGLKIKWWDKDNFDYELKGVGVNFEIPDVLKFDGKIAFLSDGIEGFKGDIDLDLMTIGLEMDAAIMVGKRSADGEEFKFFYIYLGVELPTGIPLGCSGAGLYGVAGLFAYNMEPDKRDDEEWYEEGWYKREPEGVTSTDKWEDEKGSLAIGGGITLGTIADNGYLISAKALLVVVIPGPIIIIEGKANILKPRSSLTEEGVLKALAVIDNRAGQFLINIEAMYKYDEEEGRVLDIHGGAEVFFDYHNTNNWHLYLGEKDPREKRIRAEIISLFGAEVYFMLEPTRLAWGFWLGFDERWEFGPVRIVAAAWAEGGIDASWKPEHFWGKLWLHGELGIKIFFIEFGLYLDAGIEGNTPTPYYVLMALKVGIKFLWWDFEIGIDLKWERPKEPPWPLPLKEAAIGHEIVQENILLPRNLSESEKDAGKEALLLPNYDRDKDDFIDNPDELCGEPITPEDREIPVVPLDARPFLTFGKPMWDTAGDPKLDAGGIPKLDANGNPVYTSAGDNAYPLDPEWQKLGHEGEDETLKDYEYKFELIDLLLQKKVDGDWKSCAHTGQESPEDLDPDTPFPPIYGTWQAVEGGEGNPIQTKLQLWTKTPFSFSRYSTRDYVDAFSEDNPDYPCVPDYNAEKVCVNFGELPLDATYKSLDLGNIEIDSGWQFSIVNSGVCFSTDFEKALHFKKIYEGYPSIFKIFITFPDPVCWFNIKSYLKTPAMVEILNKDGEILTEIHYGPGDNTVISYGEQGCAEAGCEIKSIVIKNQENFNYLDLCLFEICYLSAAECEKEATSQEYRSRTQEMLAYWYDEGKILEPYTTYRLKITTRVNIRRNEAEEPDTEKICEYVFFKTEGPPGFVELKGKDIPSPQGNGSIPHEHPLDRLDLYVNDTVPQKGQNPFYRAYDIGVEFNRDYVELMYKIAKHDLGIYLFDNNGQPVKDAFGRIITLSNVWGKAEELELSEAEETYADSLEDAACLDFDRDSIPRNDVLENSAMERYLLPQKLYEARVIPMLLHTTFYEESRDITRIENEGNRDEPHEKNNWNISSSTIEDKTIYYLNQTSNIHTKDAGELDLPACRGTYYLYGDESLTDYRLIVILASGDEGAIGVMFRYRDLDNYYRFSMDRERKYRRLIKMKRDSVEILAEDEWIYEKNHIYEVVIEVIGSSIKVFLDGELIPDFDVTDRDRDVSAGKIALYCWANTDARFYEVMVEDLSENAKSVYSFPFTTSRYANFFHHIHSFNDLILEQNGIQLSEIVDVEKFDAGDDENMWTKPVPMPENVEIAIVKGESNENTGFLLKSPEPIDWERVGLEVKKSNTLIDLGMPCHVKLTGFYDRNYIFVLYPKLESDLDTGSISEVLIEQFEAKGFLLSDRAIIEREDEEWVITDEEREYVIKKEFDRLNVYEKSEKMYLELIVREDTCLYDWEIEYTENLENPEWKPFYIFKGLELFSKTEFSDEDFVSLPSAEGSYFIAGDINWKNYRFTADIELAGKDTEAGILFRYCDKGNYYKLVVSNAGGLRLFKKLNNDFTLIGSSDDTEVEKFFEKRDSFLGMLIRNGLFKVSETENIKRYRLTVEVNESRIGVFFNGELCFEIDDKYNIGHGCIGAFFLPRTEVTFDELSVISLEKKTFPSGQGIQIYNSNKKQIRQFFENKLVFNSEKLIPDFIAGSYSGKAFRIVDENGGIIHLRSLLPDDEFEDGGSIKIISSPDGTAALILPEGDHIEANKLYRFEFIFSKNKEGLPTLKQWGLDSDEIVNIEFRLLEE